MHKTAIAAEPRPGWGLSILRAGDWTEDVKAPGRKIPEDKRIMFPRPLRTCHSPGVRLFPPRPIRPGTGCSRSDPAIEQPIVPVSRQLPAERARRRFCRCAPRIRDTRPPASSARPVPKQRRRRSDGAVSILLQQA